LLVVDGGFGIGKIVVALHCVVYLFYEDLWFGYYCGGLFFVGFYELYFVYVFDVLFSFGEEGVRICILCDFVFEGVTVCIECDLEVVCFKFDVCFFVVFQFVVELYEEVLI